MRQNATCTTLKATCRVPALQVLLLAVQKLLAESFVAGPAMNVQFMIKDSKKYAATGGWGFGHFVNGKPLTDSKKMEACYDCHSENTERDMVFTRYAP